MAEARKEAAALEASAARSAQGALDAVVAEASTARAAEGDLAASLAALEGALGPRLEALGQTVAGGQCSLAEVCARSGCCACGATTHRPS